MVVPVILWLCNLLCVWGWPLAHPNSPHSCSIMAAWSQFGEDNEEFSLSSTSGTVDSTRSLMAVALSILIWPHSVVIHRLKRLQKWLAVQWKIAMFVLLMCHSWATVGWFGLVHVAILIANPRQLFLRLSWNNVWPPSRTTKKPLDEGFYDPKILQNFASIKWERQ